MSRPPVSPSRASDVLLAAIMLLALAVMVPLDPLATIALAVLTTALIVWPFGVLVWLARRWARAGDLRFVLLAVVLAVAAIGAASAAVLVTG